MEKIFATRIREITITLPIIQLRPRMIAKRKTIDRNLDGLVCSLTRKGEPMEAKLKALAKRCKNRGGDCPCVGRCQAIDNANQQLDAITLEERDLKQRRERIVKLIRRLSSKPATLKSDFVFAPNLDPVIVFDGDESSFGYEDRDGNWIDQDVWPFNEDFVWADDCERLGFRVE